MNKRIIFRSFALGIAGMTLMLSSCVKGELDEPPINIPKVDFEANTTIAQLKSTYPNALDSIAQDIIIKGIVTANDESGNLYKKVVIQDETGGIELDIDKSYLYNDYHVGQRLYVKCKGMYIGRYNGLPELGYIYSGKIGRLPEAMIKNHIFLDSLPGKAPEPKVIDLNNLSLSLVNMLVRIDNVVMQEAGQPWSTATASTDRHIKNGPTNFVVRTSNYANFAAELIPAGAGSLVGVMGIFNNTYQLAIRDTADIIGFNGTIPPGPQAFLDEPFDSQPSNWVIYSVASNKNWEYDATYKYMWANGYGGDVASDDWLITPAMDMAGSVNDTLSFRAWTKYTDSGLPNPLEVLMSTNYTGSGDPNAASWSPVAINLPAANSAAWTTCIAPISVNNSNVRFAFRYRSSGVSSSTASKWEIDAVKVTGTK